MQRARDAERICFAERRWNGVESVLAIERDILQCIEDVEPANPGRDCDRQRNQHPPRIAPAARDREITTHWRDRQANSEHEVRPASKALGVAVEENPRQRYRRE